MKKRTAAYVLEQMRKRGAILHASYEKDQCLWFLSGDRRPLANNVGQAVSRDPHVCSVGDCLFAGGLAQTFRYTFTPGEPA